MTTSFGNKIVTLIAGKILVFSRMLLFVASPGGP
jgi:hypothetical protein